MSPEQEDLLCFGYWGATMETAEGYALEQATQWRNYYGRKLGMIALED